MEIYYSGTATDIKKQQKCKHSWHGPFNDWQGEYYKCVICHCTKRIVDYKEAQAIDKKEALHNLGGAFVHSVNLDFDFVNGGGVVTLYFYKNQNATRRIFHEEYKEPLHTEISFPFETLTVKRRD